MGHERRAAATLPSVPGGTLGRRGRRSPRWGGVVCGGAAAVLFGSAVFGGKAVEVPLQIGGVGGLVNVELSVGTPPKTLWASIDTGSSGLWIADAECAQKTDGSGYRREGSSTAMDDGGETSITYADGLTVEGYLLRETITIGGCPVDGAPLLVARNVSGAAEALLPADRRTQGILGLSVSDTSKKGPKSFFGHLFEARSDISKSYRLELGGTRPRLIFGEKLQEGPRQQGGVRLLADHYTTMVSGLLYASVRAMGVSTVDSQSLHSSVDFNHFFPFGGAALLDSGAGDIRLGTGLFNLMLAAMPAGCEREATNGVDSKHPGPSRISCDCSKPGSEEKFPTISLSFESYANLRFLGVDAGYDLPVCIPPINYVSTNPKTGKCYLAIVEVGKSTMFGVEAFVLGMPFFRSAAVAFDAERRLIAFGAGVNDASDAGMQAQSGPVGAPSSSPPCLCADPKSWLVTGRRLSLTRVVLVLSGVFLLLAYVHLRFSESAWLEGVRGRLMRLSAIIGERGSRLVARESARQPMHAAGGSELSGLAASWRRRGAGAPSEEMAQQDQPFVAMPAAPTE